MTIKFNFYDIYGFALPGFLLLALLWLPFGLLENRWPDAEFSSALVAIIVAYIAGHVLQTVAQITIPSSLPDGRYPSSKLLDEEDKTFSKEFKNRLRDQINKAFELDVINEGVRRDAFFLCRSALIKSKTVIYAEQFEGLYALMRGLSAAFAIAVFYYVGWACSGLLQPIKRLIFEPESWISSGSVALAAIIAAFIASLRLNRPEGKPNDRDKRRKSDKRTKAAMLGSLVVAAFAAGYYLGLLRVEAFNERGLLTAVAVLSSFASHRCYTGYRGFAQEFAKAVYRDFSNYEKPAQGQQASANENMHSES